MHDDTSEWNKKVPLLCMEFSNPREHTHWPGNNAVAHGYDLWYETWSNCELLMDRKTFCK